MSPGGGASISLLFCLCLLLANCSALIPLIGWSNSEAFSTLTGSQYSSANQFIYDASLDDIDIIVIFKTPELSFDNLAKYGGGFGGKDPAMAAVQAEIKGSKSSTWVGVDGTVASDLVSTLSFIMDTQPHVITGPGGLTNQKHELVLVELLSTSESAGLSEQDDVIAKVMAALRSLPNSPSYAVMYTSNHAYVSQFTSERQEVRRSAEDNQGHRVRRAVNPKAAAASSESSEPRCANFFADQNQTSCPHVPCMMFCFTDLRILRRNATRGVDDPNPMELLNPEIIYGSCNGTDTEDVCRDFGGPCVTFTADINDTDVPVNFTFVFKQGSCEGSNKTTCGFWTMELFVGGSEDQEGNKYRRKREGTNIFTQFFIPEGASYACGDNELNVFQAVLANNSQAPDNDVLDEYKFFGIQVQVFPSSSYRITCDPQNNFVFSTAYNCQSYISTAPLMGLVTLVILLLVLYCSVAFTFSMKTQDRFDDPRGPTISVENLH